jgi:hypothetical protein
VAHFIRIVDDLHTICKTGSNESFFSGDNYLQMSDNMAQSVRIWCQKNLGTVRLKSEDATDDEPLELYVIRLGETKGANDLKSLMTELGGRFLDIMSKAVRDVDAKNVMTSKANEAFDAVEEAARLRTLLLKVKGRRRSSPASALLLNV